MVALLTVRMTVLALLHHTVLSQSASLPYCYKIPPSNTPSPPIVNKYRQRYGFVLKQSLSSSSSTKRQGSQVLSTKCPFQWAIDDKPQRFPRSFVYAKCDGCDANVCKPLKFSHKVLYEMCDYKTGEMVWRWTEEQMTVAYVYTGN